VPKKGLYSERHRTLPEWSSTSIFLSDTGGRAPLAGVRPAVGLGMYWARASRALEEVAGIFAERSTLKTTVGPVKHVLRKSLVDEHLIHPEHPSFRRSRFYNSRLPDYGAQGGSLSQR